MMAICEQRSTAAAGSDAGDMRVLGCLLWRGRRLPSDPDLSSRIKTGLLSEAMTWGVRELLTEVCDARQPPSKGGAPCERSGGHHMRLAVVMLPRELPAAGPDAWSCSSSMHICCKARSYATTPISSKGGRLDASPPLFTGSARKLPQKVSQSSPFLSVACCVPAMATGRRSTGDLVATRVFGGDSDTFATVAGLDGLTDAACIAAEVFC